MSPVYCLNEMSLGVIEPKPIFNWIYSYWTQKRTFIWFWFNSIGILVYKFDFRQNVSIFSYINSSVLSFDGKTLKYLLRQSRSLDWMRKRDRHRDRGGK